MDQSLTISPWRRALWAMQGQQPITRVAYTQIRFDQLARHMEAFSKGFRAAAPNEDLSALTVVLMPDGSIGVGKAPDYVHPRDLMRWVDDGGAL